MRARLAKLDELGEDAVFRLYLEVGTVKAVTEQLFEPAVEGAKDWGRMEFYRWLREDPERWDRFREVRRLRAHVEADEVLEAAKNVTPNNATAQRVKIDAYKWRAERFNREDYGPPQASVNVAVGIGRGMAGGA